MPSKPSIYWDSCVFLDRLKRRPDRISILEATTDVAAAGEFIIVTSSVAIAEVIKLPEIGLTTSEQIATIEAFFENAWLSVRIVDEVIAKTAASLRRDYGIKTCDALHVATALRYGVPILYTYDGLAEAHSRVIHFCSRTMAFLAENKSSESKFLRTRDHRRHRPTVR